jgi:aminoglycoside phosphotransferase (APT) family kinase protein
MHVLAHVPGTLLRNAIVHSISPSAIEEILRLTGRWLARLHDGGPRGTGPFAPIDLRNLVRDWRKDAQEGRIDIWRRPLFLQLCDHALGVARRDWKQTMPLAVGHGDFHGGNMIVEPDGGLTGLDISGAELRSVSFDLTRMVVLTVVFTMPGDGLDPARLRAALLDGFGTSMETSPGWDFFSAFHLLRLWVNMPKEYAPTNEALIRRWAGTVRMAREMIE